LNGTSITARTRTIRIGRNTMIGPDCMIVDSDFHVPWPPEDRGRYAGEYDADVTIGPNVWIGARCIVLKGTSIGADSVVAAGSVVRGVVPAGTLVAGSPARVVKRYR
jgi:acetyltransferase-like isoleucine patch superfamily enzyme